MDDVRLYHGDCLEIMRTLPDGEADMIFADPPFNAGKKYKGDLDDARPVAEYYAWLDERLSQMVRLLTPGGTLWLMQDQRHVGWCQVRLVEMGLDFRNIVVWAYTNPTPARYGLPKTWRPILFMSKGAPKHFDGQADEMLKETLYHTPARAKTHWPHDLWPDIPKLVGGFLAPPELLLDEAGRFAHLAQMPVKIAERAIKLATQPGDTVLDPFMGSGTTGVACVRTGRRFIGIEIGLTYYAIAQRRIAEAQSQPPLFPPSNTGFHLTAAPVELPGLWDESGAAAGEP